MIKIIPIKGEIDNEIKAPPSKGHTLRALFVASLADGKTILKNPLLAEDQHYAIRALKKFGIGFSIKNNKVEVSGSGGNLKLPDEKIFIGNSGLCARFFSSFAALAPDGKIIIDGVKRMRDGRPIQDLINALQQLGVKIRSISGNGCLPIEIAGKSFLGGRTKLKGGISSQYFSSILISAPYGKKNTTIECSGKISSRPYIDITQQMMEDFGVKMINTKYKKFFIKNNQRYRARTYQIEGDYTNSSYFMAATAICGGKIRIGNLRSDSAQGDKIFPELLKKMGCQVKKGKQEIEIKCMGKLKPIKKIDMNFYPDLVPTLAVVSAFIKGKTEIYNIGHLRFKECDRLMAMATELRKIGVKVKEKKGGLVIEGDPQKIRGAAIDCYNDHRIAMAFSVVGLKTPDIIIKNEECVKKSFTDFYRTFKKIGGKYKYVKT